MQGTVEGDCDGAASLVAASAGRSWVMSARGLRERWVRSLQGGGCGFHGEGFAVLGDRNHFAGEVGFARRGRLAACINSVVAKAQGIVISAELYVDGAGHDSHDKGQLDGSEPEGPTRGKAPSLQQR